MIICLPAEAQSLASSQAGEAGAAAFSDAVYNYIPVRECLGGRAVQAQNAAAGKPLNPQPPPPPPSSKRPAGARSLCRPRLRMLLPSMQLQSLMGFTLMHGQVESMEQGTVHKLYLLQHCQCLAIIVTSCSKAEHRSCGSRCIPFILHLCVHMN